jgi:hypothetical protein
VIVPLTCEPALFTAMVYVFVAFEATLSVTLTLVSVTVPTVVGVPLMVSVLPPVLVALKPLVKLSGVPFVGTVVPLIVQLNGDTPPEAVIVPV